MPTPFKAAIVQERPDGTLLVWCRPVDAEGSLETGDATPEALTAAIEQARSPETSPE